jgi:D-alanyl-D-alanine dipeptidase
VQACSSHGPLLSQRAINQMKCFNLIHIFVFISVLPFFGGLAYANEVEMKFIKAGLVDVNDIDSTIQVDLVNSDPKKNYFRENYYKGLSRAYLRKEIAIKLSKSQKY